MNAEYRGKMPLPQGLSLACWVHERNCHRSWNKGSALYSPQGVNGLNNYVLIIHSVDPCLRWLPRCRVSPIYVNMNVTDYRVNN